VDVRDLWAKCRRLGSPLWEPSLRGLHSVRMTLTRGWLPESTARRLPFRRFHLVGYYNCQNSQDHLLSNRDLRFDRLARSDHFAADCHVALRLRGPLFISLTIRHRLTRPFSGVFAHHAEFAPGSNLSSRTMRSRSLLLAGIAILLVSALAFVVVNAAMGIDDAYAEWGAADMVIDCMRAHDGRWPSGWQALRPLFEAGGGRVGGWSFQQYQSRVFIDFNADVDDLRRLSTQSSSVPFDVIHGRWTCLHWGGGPNEILYRYFREMPKVTDPHPQASKATRSPKCR
jgi:hypothetical protein